jgi:hypothetical protein
MASKPLITVTRRNRAVLLTSETSELLNPPLRHLLGAQDPAAPLAEKRSNPCDCGDNGKLLMLQIMNALLNRATRAIAEGHALRDEHRWLIQKRDSVRGEWRLAALESTMMRMEIKAHRDHHEKGRPADGTFSHLIGTLLH